MRNLINKNKTKSQLLKEILNLQQRIIELKKAETERKKTEKALRESEEKYRVTFESTGTATTIVEEDTTLSLVNSEFERLSGYSKKEIEGKKSWTEFVVKEDLERMKEYHRLRRINENLAPRNYEFRFIDRYGNVKNIFLTISMIPGTKKSIASLLDITEHKRREKELKILFQIASLLNSGLNVEEILEKIVDAINEVLGFNHCSLRLVDKERNVLVTKVIRGLGEEYWKYRKEVPIGKHDYDLSGLTALKGKPHYVRDLMTIDFPKETKENIIKKFNLKSYLCIPIKVKKEVLGVLSIMTQEYKEFSENEMRLLTTLAELAGQAISRAQLYDLLKESEEKYRTMVETANDLIWALDTKGNFIYFNKRAEEVSGYKFKDWKNKSFVPLIVPEDLPNVQRVFKETLKGKSQSYKVRVYKKDGGIFILSVNTAPIFRKGEVVGTVSFGRDITQQVELERKLSTIHELNQKMALSSSENAIIQAGLDAMENILNLRNSALLLVDEKNNELYIKAQRGGSEKLRLPLDGDKGVTVWVAKTGKPIIVPDVRKEPRYVGKKGEILSEMAVPLIIKNKVLGVLNVESEKLNAFGEEDLKLLQTLASGMATAIENVRLITDVRQSEEKYRTLVETSNDGIISMDEKGKIMFWNKAAQKIFGYSKEEIIGKPITILIPEEYREKHIRGVKRILEKAGQVKGTLEVEGLKKNGERFPLEFSFSVCRSNDAITFIAVLRDITERKKMEEKLKKSEKLYKSLFEFNKGVLENSPAGIIRLDKDLKIVYENPEMERIMGVPPGEKSKTMGMDVREIPALKEAGISDIFNDLLKGKEILGEVSFTSMCGKKTYLSFSGVPILEENEFKGAVLLVNDITDRKELEQQLLQAQKMEGIGRLAGGIAHDFNNLLTSIIGYAEMAQMKISPKEPCYNYMNQILTACEQAKNLIEKILTFSRKVLTQPKVFNLNTLIENFKGIIERILGEDIELVFILEEKLGNIKADPHQIEQIIMNLVVNSRDAMPKGGKLIIETKNVEFARDHIKQYPSLNPGNYVLLSISDTGCGIDEKILPHIFEPFFTTKKKGEGTGLGLSIVFGIVKESGGHIEVYSKVGKGTTIKIYFPRVEEEAEEITPLKLSKLSPGKETILIIEDEESVRELVVKILSQHGYKTLSAKNKEEAFHIWKKCSEKIDLVLTDIVMPGANGWDLAKKLTKLKPKLKVLYMTGYAEDIISNYMALNRNIPFLRKPFTPGELLKKIREVLNS